MKILISKYFQFIQVLSDQNNFDRADELYEEAIKIDPLNANLFVHRGLITLQWKGDIVKAVELITKYVFSFHEFFTFDIYVNLKKKIHFTSFFMLKNCVFPCITELLMWMINVSLPMRH